MAGVLPGDSSHHGVHEGGVYKHTQEITGEGGHWYFSRKEIEENSLSKEDGIDFKKETYLRKSYCSFLQDLGMRLKVPQVTIATAIIFCHRFFLRQSLAKNDRRTIATVCMFLAGKVEETPRPLKDVIMVSYEIIHKKDPEAIQRIKQKEVYEQQKELILIGERVVLATLAFDLNVLHPYKPLVEAIKKFKVAQNALAQVAWNFVNDGLRTSLCLQFKPHHIAAGAIFLAAKFLKVKLPSDGEKVWWQEFDVTPRQLEEVSNQMLELYEQNRVAPSATSEVDGNACAGATHRNPSKVSTGNEENATSSTHSLAGGIASIPGTSKSASSRSMPEQADNHRGAPRTSQNRSNDWGNTEMRSASDHKAAGELKDNHHPEGEHREGTLGQSPHDAIKKIDRDKVKAALEKRRKSRGDTTQKMDFMDEDDLIEKELEDGIELNAESEKNKHARRQSWSKPSNRPEQNNLHAGDGHQGMTHEPDLENVEEGEFSVLDNDNDDQGSQLPPKSSNRKRKAGSPHNQHHDHVHRSSHHYNHHDYSEDRNKTGRHGYAERDHKRHVPENHV